MKGYRMSSPARVWQSKSPYLWMGGQTASPAVAGLLDGNSTPLEQIHVHMLKEDCGLQIVKIFVSLQWAEAIFLIRADAWVCQLADPVLSHSHWQRATGPLPELIRPLDKSYVRPCWRKSGGNPSSFSHLNGCVQFTTCVTVL